LTRGGSVHQKDGASSEGIRFESEPDAGDGFIPVEKELFVAILEVRDIYKTFGERQILDGISFSVEEGEACAIIGPSGEGKTTLLKCINLLTPIDKGEIRFDGQVTVRSAGEDGPVRVEMDPTSLRRRVGMVFQEWNLLPNMTIRENIALAPRYVRGLSKIEAGTLAAELSERVKIAEKLDSYPNSLSGGQKQRAAIARALAMNPEVLMLDEVTSALDPVLAAEVLDVMTDLKKDGRTLIVVTHHIDFARAVSDKVIYLHHGKVHETGTPEMLDNPRSAELKWFLKQVRKIH
jgi:polar amino acid transport system ATP-binding protein